MPGLNEINHAVFPIKSYEDLVDRWQRSFSFPFVHATFNAPLAEIVRYTRLGVGADPHGRYDDYAAQLIETFHCLELAGVSDLLDLMSRVDTRDKLADFADRAALPATEIASALKFLVYWYIPIEKYLSGLVRPGDSALRAAVAALAAAGVRTNLDLLQRGLDAAGRVDLAAATGLPQAVITGLVHRADLSRMPWASKATISNIIGTGYGSLSRLAGANPEKLADEYYRYGKSIGKNLKLGNEIENSHRIAKILPVVLAEPDDR